MYLSYVQTNLGFFFQTALRYMKLSPSIVQKKFLESEIPYQIEIASPDFLCGKSGYELAIIAFKSNECESAIKIAQSEPFYPEKEYWSGYVLAYVQWKLSLKFNEILNKYPLERLLCDYDLLHEADISNIANIIKNIAYGEKGVNT